MNFETISESPSKEEVMRSSVDDDEKIAKELLDKLIESLQIKNNEIKDPVEGNKGRIADGIIVAEAYWEAGEKAIDRARKELYFGAAIESLYDALISAFGEGNSDSAELIKQKIEEVFGYVKDKETFDFLSAAEEKKKNQYVEYFYG
jgi:hypothetical protein